MERIGRGQEDGYVLPGQLNYGSAALTFQHTANTVDLSHSVSLTVCWLTSGALEITMERILSKLFCCI